MPETLIWQSFGASRAILSCLSELDVLKMQALNKFWYDVGTSRVQTSVITGFPVYFVDKYRNSYRIVHFNRGS